MNIDIMPAGQIAMPGASEEAKIILRAVRSYILQDAEDLSFVGVDWGEVKNIAMQNKLAVHVLRGMNKSAKEIPSDLRIALEEYQSTTFGLNSVNLVTL